MFLRSFYLSMRSGEYGLPGSELICRGMLRHGSNVVDVRSCSSAVSVAYSYSKVHPNDFDLRGLPKARTEHDVNQCEHLTLISALMAAASFGFMAPMTAQFSTPPRSPLRLLDEALSDGNSRAKFGDYHPHRIL